jgi:hypothetical protein
MRSASYCPLRLNQSINQSGSKYICMYCTLVSNRILLSAAAAYMVAANAGALSAYRYLLRSIRIAFKEDHVMLLAARKEARRRFNEGRITNINSPDLVEQIEEATNVGKFLRQNLVQGVKTDKDDRYRN